MSSDRRANLTILINGSPTSVSVAPDRTLLLLLREDLGLVGTKYGCGRGECGACTVHLDGKAVYSCLMLAAECNGRAVTTIESLGGLGEGGSTHPLLSAIVEEDALQCGYCTPGQAMSILALLEARPNPTDEEILETLEGNLCRCGAYPGLVRAARRAAMELRAGGAPAAAMPGPSRSKKG
ncbi:MAG: (2Fe-2S)-binding protein [Candidatus Eisenbacteria bacterium]|nr:(2Fe-2S)-binding protein [Candidatus Eisenbacteria bacterium]